MTVEQERGPDLANISLSAVLRNQSPSGAFIASPDFSQYGYCWLRDGSFTSYALDRVGEHAASERYHAWVESALDGIAGLIDAAVAHRRAGEPVDPGQLPPARFALDGSVVVDDWPNFQIDGYGTWLWALHEHQTLAGNDYLTESRESCVERVARYLATYAFDPCFDVWEMFGDEVHTSTLASVYAGLIAAAELLGDRSFASRAEEVRGRVVLAARAAGRYQKSSAQAHTEASTLWLSTPFGLTENDDPLFTNTVAMVERDLGYDGGLRRFPADTYFGGGAWPVLTASLGWHYASLGNEEKARTCLRWIEERFDATGDLAEQFGGEYRNLQMFDEWVAQWGPPARELIWSHAMHLVLRVEIDSRGGAGG